MSNSVLLLTDRPAFEQAWRSGLERSGLEAEALSPESLIDAIREGSVIVIDAGCEVFDEDELLAHVGLARALRTACAVVLPEGEHLTGIEELLEDLCPGLVARGNRDVDRIAATLARRADARHDRAGDRLDSPARVAAPCFAQTRTAHSRRRSGRMDGSLRLLLGTRGAP